MKNLKRESQIIGCKCNQSILLPFQFAIKFISFTLYNPTQRLCLITCESRYFDRRCMRMDESWRMQMGMPGFPRRRSTEDTSLDHRTRRSKLPGRTETPETLDSDDFADVFGGPPRSLLIHKLSRSTSFYEEISHPPDFIAPLKKLGRKLPPFKIPENIEAFYTDIFGSDDERKSRERSGQISKTKSMSNSPSMLSSEDFSPPLRQPGGDDVALSAFASKLRPINVPCKWNSLTMMSEKQQKIQGVAAFPYNSPTFENQYPELIDFKERFKTSYMGFSKKVTSPETINLEPNSDRSIRVPVDDWELNSPSSAVSSLCHDIDKKSGVQEDIAMEHDEDEAMSSYVIELNSNQKVVDSDVIAMDEAIAWAKEKFLTETRDKDKSKEIQGVADTRESHIEIYGHGLMQSPKKLETEMEELDKEVRLWSTGRESDIRLLLSTLHNILHGNSGWYAIPLTDLTESSQVKNAYHRARLCLHPDKLQQRGGTPSQKYIAEKAFSILQDAWTKFISQDVFFHIIC